MNYINKENSLSMDNFGTEKSATSSFVPQAGGFAGQDVNRLAIAACKRHEFAGLSFLVRYNLITDYRVQDPETGCTVLHCIAKHYYKIPDVADVLSVILTRPDVQSFINIQDRNGDTPLHVALRTDNQVLCNLLIRAGANPRIRNRMNQYVATDDEYSVKQYNPYQQYQPNQPYQPYQPYQQYQQYPPGYGSSVFAPKNKQNPNDTGDIVALLLAVDEKDVVTEYSPDMPSSLRTADVGQSDLFNTDKFLNDIMKGPASSSSGRLPLNLQQNDINFVGGSRVTKGSRRMNLYSEFDELYGGWDSETRTSDRNGNETSDEYPELEQKYKDRNRPRSLVSNDGDMDDYAQVTRVPNRSSSQDSNEGSRNLSREIKNQVDQIHERTVKKIEEIMNVPESVARNYKAALYRRVKEEHPELSGYERAIEMEKLATKDNLEKIDIDRVTREINAHIENKQKERETNKPGTSGSSGSTGTTGTQPKKRATRKKATDTSSVSAMSESGLSATSEWVY